MNGDSGNSTVPNGSVLKPPPHPIHYVILGMITLAIFVLDVRTPLGIAV